MEEGTLMPGLEKLQKLIRDNFGPPFLEDGLVTSSLSKDGKKLTITIGPRDIEIDECGTVLGAGTCLFSNKEVICDTSS